MFKGYFTHRFAFVVTMALIIFVTHHISVYIHEWAHGLVTWLAGYKNHPFDIHYGDRWITLLDIDQAVPYDQILSEGKPSVVASIAIAPILLQIILFPLGLKLLNIEKIQNHRWIFAFVFWWTLFELAQTYSYIPIRTFSKSDDIYDFLSATGLSPWIIALPGTLFVIWGIYRMLALEVPRAYFYLRISSKLGRFAFLFTAIVFIFGYYGTPGFFKPDLISRTLTWLSWALVPISLVLFSKNLLRS